MATFEPTITKPQSSEIRIPEDWENAANTIAHHSWPPVTLICGPKNTGKSTFSRHLLNGLLRRYKRVAYLDTDVGQPEFTPAGCLSLTLIDQGSQDLTIPCMKTPERFFFFGDVSSKRDPEGYLKCVIALHDHYRKEQSSSRKNGVFVSIPLIVNTPGWVKGIGFHILVDMLKLIGPTHVVKINDINPNQKRRSPDGHLNKKILPKDKNLPEGVFWLGGDHYGDDSSVYLLEIASCMDCSSRQVLVQKEARRNRERQLESYFKQCFPSDAGITTSKELARAIASHIPYQVSIPHINIRHLHCKVSSTELLYSLNATIVGLAVSSGDPQSLPVCVGLGIVRGIDMLKNLLYVITPVPRSILARVDTLLQGLIQIPTNLLQVQGCVSPYMSTNVLPEIPSEKIEENEGDGVGLTFKSY